MYRLRDIGIWTNRPYVGLPLAYGVVDGACPQKISDEAAETDLILLSSPVSLFFIQIVDVAFTAAYVVQTDTFGGGSVMVFGGISHGDIKQG